MKLSRDHYRALKDEYLRRKAIDRAHLVTEIPPTVMQTKFAVPRRQKLDPAEMKKMKELATSVYTIGPDIAAFEKKVRTDIGHAFFLPQELLS